jgi:hypothetical protein
MLFVAFLRSVSRTRRAICTECRDGNYPVPKQENISMTTQHPGQQPEKGIPASEQDPKRRLGNFQGAGEPARKGSRTSGIGGQSKQQNKTDQGGK